MARAALVVAALVGLGFAQSWELRVCAEPANLPFSNAAGEGFENRIAELLADELDARLTYEWLPSPSNRYRNLYLHNGRCDAVMGISDGHEGFLTTIAYYRSSYVFVTRSDASFEIESLDDPDLETLAIAVAGDGRTGPERLALSARGLGDNLLISGADQSQSTSASSAVEAVIRGEADVAVVWGPVAGIAAARAEVGLDLRPVTPQIDRAFLPMVIPVAIGVRPHDVALRDALSRALTSRWSGVQSVLESHQVPLQDLPVPTPGPTSGPRGQQAEDGLAVGIVLPLAHSAATGNAEGVGDAAEAARRGALLAEEDLVRASEEPSAPPVHLFLSSARGVEALRRAAQRLVATDGVDALVGGFGEEQARVLGQVASEHDLLFLNIGASAESLRGANLPGSFHIEASDSMYLEALLTATQDRQPTESWFLVRADSDRGRELEQTARRLLSLQDATKVAGSGVFEAMGNQNLLFERIESADPDRVLVLMDGRAQLEFLGLYDAFALEPALTILPEPMTQTHGFQLALQQSLSQVDSVRVASLWEEDAEPGGSQGSTRTSARFDAVELNDSYLARWGSPMEATAWAAYQALSILWQASEVADGASAAQLRDVMRGEDATFEVDEGTPLAFDSDGQLRQPVYVVRIERNAQELADIGVVVGEHFSEWRAP